MSAVPDTLGLRKIILVEGIRAERAVRDMAIELEAWRRRAKLAEAELSSLRIRPGAVRR